MEMRRFTYKNPDSVFKHVLFVPSRPCKRHLNYVSVLPDKLTCNENRNLLFIFVCLSNSSSH